ncbi:protein FAM124A isoform X2 [Mustela erminea]|uniref:protein FAM124A isoform X2 n=1 Tax=Mustela erminea TaxID=36723 RepID=UPI0013875F6C|nr:protein FAM124A isoform X2 [Mustela erminea]
MDPKAGGGEEDDCVDSGAETGGSDYSHMSSTSSELSVEEAQDPFLVSIHIIADPGESQPLQEAIDKVLAWIHPDLQLFRVSERRASRRRRKPWKVAQPALAVVLFLQEEYGEEQILQLHRALQRPPWRLHHTERVPGRFLPYLPCSQDFFTLAPGTPLWAIRPVHYGKEIVRFTIYCRHDNYADILKFYELILRRSPSQKKTDFCIFPIFSNLDVDIQFSLKRLPCDQTPIPTDSSVLEFRVKDIGELVPLLPNPCSPISEGRWQTEDLDGNKILLQAQRVKEDCWTLGQWSGFWAAIRRHQFFWGETNARKGKPSFKCSRQKRQSHFEIFPFRSPCLFPMQDTHRICLLPATATSADSTTGVDPRASEQLLISAAHSPLHR